MIQPKDLYRKLAALLSDIDKQGNDANYLLSVLGKLEQPFARDLHIINGRLYAEDHEHFLPVIGVQDVEQVHPPEHHALDPDAAELVVRNGVYLFTDPSLVTRIQHGQQPPDAAAASFSVKSPRHKWIFVFSLGPGWVWEEVEFCLNAVRAQLNFQLHLDAMNNDVAQAAVIQLSLLPNRTPEITGYETSGRTQPSDVVGGDFFDFSILDEEFFTVAVGDASGHGLPAALLVRDVVTGLRMGVEKEMRMAEAMQKLNRVIHRSTLSSNFVSLFFAEIESNGNILYVNAGHPPPLLVHGTRVARLESTGMILGAVSETQFHRASATFEPGSVLVLFSDGVVERRRDDEEFGVARLQDIVVSHQGETASKILHEIYKSVTEFGDPTGFEDDVTVVIIKRMAA